MIRLSDWMAMEAVNAILEQYFRTQTTSTEALNQIAQIAGANKTAHQEAGPQ